MKTLAAFVLGFAAGMACLAAVLWSTGSIVTVHGQESASAPPSFRFGGPAPSKPEPPPSKPADIPSITIPPAKALPEDSPSLGVPIAGVDPSTLKSTFTESRGAHTHEALDIMAPRGTPVLAVTEGNVVKLFISKKGGLTVYQFDNSRTWCYYYAHLDRYAQGLKEGTLLRKGDVLGYVGSTGDASANAPHLHFVVFRLGPEKKWWKGTAVDPLPLLK